VRDVEIHWRSLKSPYPSGLLSEDEIESANRFRFEMHRNAFVACRSILREILAGYMATDARSIKFACNRYGKPFVSNPFFNVSHSGDVAVFAFSRYREVGIDVERIDPNFRVDQLPEYFLSVAEVAALRALPANLQTEAFFRCWTRKEAYVKAVGLGLSIPLASFEVTLEPNGPARFLRGGEGWEIESFTPCLGYVGALVGKNQAEELSAY
jgi:4'-phosphopantetheinyl transferase